MKKLSILILLATISTYSFASERETDSEVIISLVNESDKQVLLFDTEQPIVTASRAWEIKKNDIALAFVPGAVQMRRQWPAVAGVIWGGMVISGGIATYEQFHIIKLQHNSENDSYNANWYDEKIRESTKVRNGALYMLGGIYIANYISALLLKDNDPRTSYYYSIQAVPQGGVALTYAFEF